MGHKNGQFSDAYRREPKGRPSGNKEKEAGMRNKVRFSAARPGPLALLSIPVGRLYRRA
jgi:hypothetical protein